MAHEKRKPINENLQTSAAAFPNTSTAKEKQLK